MKAGLDTDGGDWSLVCEQHSWCVAVDTRALGVEFLADPAQWCEVCAGTQPEDLP